MADHHTLDLLRFIDVSPSPYHAVAETTRRLIEAGFTEHDERDPWPGGGRHVVRRGGSVVAWVEPAGADPARPFRVFGAHTDSPNLRLKPHADSGTAGYRQLAVEVYGSPLLNSWLGRDLGVSGRVQVHDGETSKERLVCIQRAIAHLPQLAIHLDRDVNDKGLLLNRQLHLEPVVGLTSLNVGTLNDLIAEALECRATDIVSADLMLHDLVASSLAGMDHELLSAPRIDNLLSCHAITTAVAGASISDSNRTGATPVLALFDHEEVGSVSATGAASTLIRSVVERIVTARGGSIDDLHRAAAASLVVSVDNAHATHPNYVERHEPGHRIALNGGPVIKSNASQRYGTDSTSMAAVVLAAEAAAVPLQHFVTRSDLACGSTIGPTIAAGLGMATVDLGAPQLAMHSCRELAGATDPPLLTRLLQSLLAH